MGTLVQADSDARELVTEIRQETTWWSTLKVLVKFLDAKHVDNVRVEFGYVLDRDLAGISKPRTRSDDSTIWNISSRRDLMMGQSNGIDLQTSAFTRWAQSWPSCFATMPTCISLPLTQHSLQNSRKLSAQVE